MSAVGRIRLCWPRACGGGSWAVGNGWAAWADGPAWTPWADGVIWALGRGAGDAWA